MYVSVANGALDQSVNAHSGVGNARVLTGKSKGGQILNVAGMVYGRLTAIRPTPHRKSGKAVWIFQCSCGKRKTIIRHNVTRGRVVSCGCYSKEIRKEINLKRRHPTGDACRHQLFLVYRKGAEKRNIQFNITESQFNKLTKMDCAYCGVPPIQLTNRPQYQRINGDYPHNGIDRKDSSKGYTIKNCLPCCKRCNYAKGASSFNEFIAWITRLRNSPLLERANVI
jgi:hypothetical protein